MCLLTKLSWGQLSEQFLVLEGEGCVCWSVLCSLRPKHTAPILLLIKLMGPMSHTWLIIEYQTAKNSSSVDTTPPTTSIKNTRIVLLVCNYRASNDQHQPGSLRFSVTLHYPNYLRLMYWFVLKRAFPNIKIIISITSFMLFSSTFYDNGLVEPSASQVFISTLRNYCAAFNKRLQIPLKDVLFYFT